MVWWLRFWWHVFSLQCVRIGCKWMFGLFERNERFVLKIGWMLEHDLFCTFRVFQPQSTKTFMMSNYDLFLLRFCTRSCSSHWHFKHIRHNSSKQDIGCSRWNNIWLCLYISHNVSYQSYQLVISKIRQTLEHRISINNVQKSLK